MAEVQLKKVSIKHEAIMEYLLVNPTQKLGEVAAYFGVSQAWLSVVINSDAFQIKLGERKDELFGATVVPLREKLLGLAHVGVEKLGEALDNASVVSDKQFIADTTDQVLKSLGYSPKSSPTPAGQTNIQNNFYGADKATLEAAREKMRNIPQPSLTLEGELSESENSAAPKGLPASGPIGEG